MLSYRQTIPPGSATARHMIKEVFLWIEFILSLSWPLLFCWPSTLFGITAIGNKTVLLTGRFARRKDKKFSLPEEFFILQDFLSLRLLFCCRMCYTIIGLQRQYAVIFIPSFNKDTHAFRQRKSALTASSSLTYASMPASSSLSSSGFPSPKSPAEFLRGRNGARGSAER